MSKRASAVRARFVAVVAAVLLVVGLLAPTVPVDAAPATGTVIGPGFYPRVVRLAHSGAANGTVLATYQLGQQGVIVRSTDGGQTFSPFSTIDVDAGVVPPPVGMCCIELFEMPTALGAFPAGTLLWAGSVVDRTTPSRHMHLGIWRSEDHGATWVPHGSCVEGDGGLWEPELLVAGDGSLVCAFSDETHQPAHSQLLAETRSTDGGLTFGGYREVVSLPIAGARPGMATTAQLLDGTWRMTYEVCAWVPSCGVRIRSSADGLDWGDPAWIGDEVKAADGSYFTHTPVLAWSPYGGPSGTLVLSGQVFNAPDGSPSPGNGQTLLINRENGVGPWTAIDAPVHIPDPFDHFCPNYSSPVLPLDGASILELATEWTGQQCLVRYASGVLPPADVATTTTSTTTSSTTAPPVDPVVTPAFTG